MPPRGLFTKEEIIAAALDLVRTEGSAALTARGLAARLGCSVKPIFGLFSGMEQVRRETIAAGYRLYLERLAQAMQTAEYPAYKASGMGYIRFAREERELFHLLFMRDRTGEDPAAGPETEALITLIQKNTGLSHERAYRLHLESWVFVHGIATMIATGYLNWEPDFISKVVSDCYFGLRDRLLEEEAYGCDHNK